MADNFDIQIRQKPGLRILSSLARRMSGGVEHQHLEEAEDEFGSGRGFETLSASTPNHSDGNREIDSELRPDVNPAGGNITPRIPWKRLNPLKMLADLSFNREEEQLQPEDEQLGLEMLSKKQFEEKIQTLQSSLPDVKFTGQQDPIVRLQLDDITKDKIEEKNNNGEKRGSKPGNMEDEDEDEDWINVNSDDVPSEECWMNKDKLEEKNQEGSDDEVDDDLLVATIQIQPGSTPSAARYYSRMTKRELGRKFKNISLPVRH